jgi:hypothetical protein
MDDLKTAPVLTIKQSELTCECWLVQFKGLSECSLCEYADTPDCGGQTIRKTGVNSLGHPVPLT